jgi:hypothetical protein
MGFNTTQNRDTFFTVTREQQAGPAFESERVPRRQRTANPTANRVNPGVPQGSVEYPVSADVPDVIGCIHLNVESIRIKELEGFFGSRIREF